MEVQSMDIEDLRGVIQNMQNNRLDMDKLVNDA